MIYDLKGIAKRFFLFPILLTTIYPAFSQDTAGMKGHGLWIKGDNPESSKSLFAKSTQKDHFNFNPIFEKAETDLVYKNILQNKYSLFVVFRSDLENETSLIRLKTFDEKIEISNRKAGDENSNVYKNINVKKGMLLSYVSSSERKVKKKGNVFSIVNLSEPNSPEGQKNELMELVYFPRLLNKVERKQTETYLSIKYGISLLGEADYIGSDSKKVWEYKENKSFNNRVTGIARDDHFNLYQKQSGNSTKDGLFIGLKEIASTNQANTNTMADKTFLLWGDNNGSPVFKSNENGQGDFKSMKRIWKMQATFSGEISDVATQVVLDKKYFPLGSASMAVNNAEEFVWLVVSENAGSAFDYQNAKYYKSKEVDNRLVFDSVQWDKDKSGSDLFTFIKAPDFFLSYTTVAPNCKTSENGKLKVKVIGGAAPFNINVTSQDYRKSITTNERESQFSYMPLGEYEIAVNDNLKNSKIEQFEQDPFKEFTISLDSHWQLNAASSIKITPKVDSQSEDVLTYKWQYKGTVVSREKELEADKTGEYQLTVTNKQGCEKELTCRVRNSEEGTRQWSIYPNPAEERQPFTINFDLEKSSEVNVAFYDIASRLVKSKNLGKIRVFECIESLPTTGIYMIVVAIDGKVESTKLIVK